MLEVWFWDFWPAEMQVLAAEGSKLDAALRLKKEGFPLKAVISFDEVRLRCMIFGAWSVYVLDLGLTLPCLLWVYIRFSCMHA